MKLFKPEADIFAPDGLAAEKALGRTTHLAVGAHQDDLELMAWHGIAACYGKSDRWFCGVTCTDGRGSPRTGPYGHYTDEQMRLARREEQREAARLGRYAAVLQLDYTSAEAKSSARKSLVEDMQNIIRATRPKVIYTHNLFDKHPTHLAVVTALLQALRQLDPPHKPEEFYGCEGWRDLDWLPDNLKVTLDTSALPQLADTVIAAFKSQIAGGKNYGLAVKGRWLANATYAESHQTDALAAASHAVNLLPLLENPKTSLPDYAREVTGQFQQNIVAALTPFINKP